MSDLHFHKLYPDEFEDAHAEAMGVIMGHMYGVGEVPPRVSAALHEAYRLAAATAFDAGFALAREAEVSTP